MSIWMLVDEGEFCLYTPPLAPNMAHPARQHSPGPFDPDTGEFIEVAKSHSAAICARLPIIPAPTRHPFEDDNSTVRQPAIDGRVNAFGYIGLPRREAEHFSGQICRISIRCVSSPDRPASPGVACAT